MNPLDRLLLQAVLLPLPGTTAALGGLLVVVELRRHEGLPWLDLPLMIPLVLNALGASSWILVPVAGALAMGLGLGRLAESFELCAITLAGWSGWRRSLAPAGVALALSGLAGGLALEVAPAARRRLLDRIAGVEHDRQRDAFEKAALHVHGFGPGAWLPQGDRTRFVFPGGGGQVMNLEVPPGIGEVRFGPGELRAKSEGGHWTLRFDRGLARGLEAGLGPRGPGVPDRSWTRTQLRRTYAGPDEDVPRRQRAGRLLAERRWWGLGSLSLLLWVIMAVRPRTRRRVAVLLETGLGVVLFQVGTRLGALAIGTLGPDGAVLVAPCALMGTAIVRRWVWERRR